MKKQLLTGCFILAAGLAIWSCEDDNEKKDDTIAVTGVTLDVSTTNLVVGTSSTLTATLAPENATDQTVTWSSGNTDVASVDSEGTVTAVAEGSTTITVETTDGGFTATCAVNVTTAVVAVTGVTLDESTLSLHLGEGATLTATITPEDATDLSVTWSSDDTSVATVDDEGNVAAVAEGTANITVTTTDGAFTATCEVTVSKIDVTGVTLDVSTASIEVGSTTTLTATIAPEDATDQTVSWSTEDNSIATVNSDGKVTAEGIGSTTITVTTTDGEFTATCEVTVTPILVSNITLDLGSRYYLSVGESYAITAGVSPDDADASLTWSSSDESVVSITSEGVITANAEGNATITATANDGSGVSASSTVSVKDNFIRVNAGGMITLVALGTLDIVKNGDNYYLTLKPVDQTSDNYVYIKINEYLLGTTFTFAEDENNWYFKALLSGTYTYNFDSTGDSYDWSSTSAITVTTETVNDQTVYIIDLELSASSGYSVTGSYVGTADSYIEE